MLGFMPVGILEASSITCANLFFSSTVLLDVKTADHCTLLTSHVCVCISCFWFVDRMNNRPVKTLTLLVW